MSVGKSRVVLVRKGIEHVLMVLWQVIEKKTRSLRYILSIREWYFTPD